jgi:acyl-CoA ligase (AMP-forming) (exosortase A-associated)
VILLLDHLPSHGKPDFPAILLRNRTVNFNDLEGMTARLAGWLAQRDLPAGSRIAAWLPKGLLPAVLPLAVARAGHVYVPVNPLLKHQQVAHILADAQASLLISQSARLANLPQAEMPEGCSAIAENDLLPILDDLSAPGLSPLASDVDPATLCQLLYTSGSTGRPKGVMLSHANLMIGARSVAGYLGLGEEDRTLGVLPLSFDYGQNQLFSSWWAGASIAPLDYLTARDVVKACARWQITTLAGVPPLWVQLVETEWPDEARRSLRRITNSGGALSSTLVSRLRETFPQTDIFAMYGLTEAFRSTYLPPDLLARHPTSMGRAIPDAEILVVRPDGSVTEDGEAGELVHGGPLVAQGYWRDAERTAERFRAAPPASRYGGTAVWSGDTVMRDSEGLLHFVGRDDAMIKSAGNRISPTEVEEAALAIAGVGEALALGQPDERLGQAVVLVVRRQADAQDGLEERIFAALRQSLPNFMQPARVHILDELPRNPNGKLDRAAIIRDLPENVR